MQKVTALVTPLVTALNFFHLLTTTENSYKKIIATLITVINVKQTV